VPWLTVATYDSVDDAYFARILLEAEGIVTYIPDECLNSNNDSQNNQNNKENHLQYNLPSNLLLHRSGEVIPRCCEALEITKTPQAEISDIVTVRVHESDFKLAREILNINKNR
jgi:hypothetical protein